jgi:D-alanyl-D-alanine carboxypeptidase
MMTSRAGKWKLAGMMAAVTACAVALTSPAAARSDHRQAAIHYNKPPSGARAVYYSTPPSAGFGPTAPGASTILIDAGNGRVITAAGADIPRYPASLTKLMVLDLAFQALRAGRMSLDTDIPVSAHAASVEPVKLGLTPGDRISVHDAILAMTTMSANDAATALGEYLGGGSEARCAQMMTLRAHALGMAQTQFYNASGLPNPYQVTTARDLSILARDIVVAYPEDQSFFEVQKFNFRGRVVFSNNQMLRLYPGATGMKTGYTILARHNLITSAVRNGRVLIGVELHEPSWGATYAQMIALLDAGFGSHMAAAPYIPPVYAAAAPAPAARRPPAARLAWAAQLGLYNRMVLARSEALAVRAMRGVGTARVAKVDHHGKVLWTAQLADLTFDAAHQTCSVLAARGHVCLIVGPMADHVALAD